jgi:hypothetical protein
MLSPSLSLSLGAAVWLWRRCGWVGLGRLLWEHFRREQAEGRTPTGADLDRVAGTNNYGRTVLRRWRAQGRIPPMHADRRNGHPVPRP